MKYEEGKIDTVDKICSTVRGGIYMVCCMLLACQVLIASGVMASRYILRHTPPWGENSTLICMVWFRLLSSAVAISEDLHLKVTLIDNLISDRARTIMDLLDLSLVFIFGVVMVSGSHGLLEPAFRNTTSGMGLLSSVLYAVISVSGLVFIIATIDRGRTLLYRLK